MTAKVGSTALTGIRVGATEVTSMYAGADLVYSSAPPAPPSIATKNWEASSNINAIGAVNAPTGITAGDLLLAFIAVSHDGEASPGVSTGWTLITTVYQPTAIRESVYGRIADGGANDTLTVSGSTMPAVVAILRIIDHAVVTLATDIEFGTWKQATGEAGFTYDPPSLDAGSSKTWLWLTTTAAYHTGSGNTIDGVPASYTDVYRLSDGTANPVVLGIASRELEAQTENPGTFSSTDNFRPYVAQTLAIP